MKKLSLPLALRFCAGSLLVCILFFFGALSKYSTEAGLSTLPTALWLPALVLFLLGSALCVLLAQRIRNGSDTEPPGRAYQELEPLIEHLQVQTQKNRLQTQQLDQRQREFVAVTENMQEGFLLLDRSGRILSRNRSALMLLGLEYAAPGDDLRQLCQEAALLHLLDQALSGSHGELLLRRGTAACQVIANAVRADQQVLGAVLLLMDVTEQAQREALRREFSANVSHELKTPLTSISGFAELMQTGLVPMEKVQEFSGDIQREAQRLLGLVNDIIKLSRLDEGQGLPEPQPVRLLALCQTTLASLASLAEKQNITLSLTGQASPIQGQEQLLAEMVYNLCDNAVKYNRPGGRVEVALAETAADVTLRVSDTGIGIPYDHQGRVFERFYRVDKSHSKVVGGTGLGLSIVKHTAQYHNARVELHSEPDVGTSICVTFPKTVETIV